MNRRVFMASLAALVSTRLFGGKAEAATPVTLTDAGYGWERNRWLLPEITLSADDVTPAEAWRWNSRMLHEAPVSRIKVTGPIRLFF